MIKKILPVILSASILFTANFTTAAKKNIFNDVKTVQLNESQKSEYIDKKINEVFNSTSHKKNYEVPRGWQLNKINYNGVNVEKYTAKKNSSDRVILFLHGGGYVYGLSDIYRDFGIHLADLAGNAVALELEYKLAPAHVYPSALDDAVNTYRGMLSDGYDPSKIVVVGDSSGANLAVALCMYLRDYQIPTPQAMILISPWLDVENKLPSREQNLQADRILGSNNPKLNQLIKNPTYFKGTNHKDPYVSPIYGNLQNLPATLIIAGSNELFLDDALLFAAREQIAGVDVQQSIYRGMSHDWIFTIPELPESKEVFDEITDFIDKHL